MTKRKTWSARLWDAMEEFEYASAALINAYDDAKWGEMRARMNEMNEAMEMLSEVVGERDETSYREEMG